jgi:hypothetical protein
MARDTSLRMLYDRMRGNWRIIDAAGKLVCQVDNRDDAEEFCRVASPPGARA